MSRFHVGQKVRVTIQRPANGNRIYTGTVIKVGKRQVMVEWARINFQDGDAMSHANFAAVSGIEIGRSQCWWKTYITELPEIKE